LIVGLNSSVAVNPSAVLLWAGHVLDVIAYAEDRTSTRSTIHSTSKVATTWYAASRERERDTTSLLYHVQYEFVSAHKVFGKLG
jgi:hypothetical protein